MATILIADDTVGVRRLLHFIFEAQHTVLEAEDGLQAIALAQEQRPDIVILDVAMPIMNGLEVCRQLRADPTLRAIGIIILSASTTPEQAQEAGADRFIEKPCHPSHLRAAVDNLLRDRQGTETNA
jgi:CheY-like chemotaxis protein